VNLERLPSFLISLCLHLGVAALIIWWPASTSAPALPTGTLVDIYFTLGAPGKSVPEAKQAIPEAAFGREQPQQVNKPQEQPQPKTVPQVEKPDQTPQPPEVKPVEKPKESVPEKTDAIPVPKEPEKPKEEAKPKEPEKPKTPEKIDIDKELRDLAKQTGTPTGSRSGSGATRGKDKDQSGGSIDKDLADLAKSLGGAGEDAGGRGPGGSGGDGVGALGDYLQVIHSRVKANWSFPAQADRRQYSTLVNIQIAPDGAITHIRRVRSSGNPFYDSSVENALVRTAKLEPPPRPDLMNIDIEFAF
jgi:colicin import membrane protein